MKNKRGFTLIELLAVIIILAIITLIATPIVINVINKTKKGAESRSIENYLHAIETGVVAYQMEDGKIENKTYRINNNGNICVDIECEKEIEIEMNGSKPSGGVVIIEDGKVTDAMNLYINSKYYTYIDGETTEFEVGGYTLDGEHISWDKLVNDGYITLNNRKTEIAGSNPEKMTNISSLVIPGGITGINRYLFYNRTSLKTVILPEGLEKIQLDTFRGSGLTSIVIPGSVQTVELRAFGGCQNLNSVIILEGVTTIGNSVFSGCSSLESVTIPESVTSIGTDAFSGCTSLESVTIPESITSIESGTFSGCSSLESITIPESVTNIGDNAFSGAGLTSITIPESVTNIGRQAFRYNALTSATFKNPRNWSAGDTELSSSDLSSTSTAANYLKNKYTLVGWTRN